MNINWMQYGRSRRLRNHPHSFQGSLILRTNRTIKTSFTTQWTLDEIGPFIHDMLMH